MELKREIQAKASMNDFSEAAKLRNRVKILESKRDNFDAEYETPRYEEMIAISFDMEEQKRANADEKMKFDANREM